MCDARATPLFSKFVIGAILSGVSGVVSAACPPGMVLMYGKCQKAQMSVDALCSYQVASSNSKLIGSQVPGDKEKLQALIAECVKNYEQQQAQETQKERQSSWQKAPDAASTPPGAALVPAPGAGSSAAVPRSALPALQAPAKVDPTAAARPLPNVPLACSMNSKGMKYGSGMPQRHYEVVARNNSGSNLPAVYRIVWTIENAKPAQAGEYKLRAPLAANASIGVGTAVQPAGVPELKACEAVAKF